MRKAFTLLLAAALVAGIVSAPATAKKKKPVKVHESFGATLLPFPKLTAWGDPLGLTRPGCTAGEQDIHWTAVEFTSPGKGTLRLYAEGFTGDWDVYVFDGDTVLAEGAAAQVGQEMAPPEEEALVPLTKGQKVTLAACNWLGEPNVEAHYEGVFK